MTFLDWLAANWHIVFFILFLGCYVVFSLAANYHCREYGYAGDATKMMYIVYSVISIVIMIGTFYFLLAV